MSEKDSLSHKQSQKNMPRTVDHTIAKQQAYALLRGHHCVQKGVSPADAYALDVSCSAADSVDLFTDEVPVVGKGRVTETSAAAPPVGSPAPPSHADALIRLPARCESEIDSEGAGLYRVRLGVPLSELRRQGISHDAQIGSGWSSAPVFWEELDAAVGGATSNAAEDECGAAWSFSTMAALHRAAQTDRCAAELLRARQHVGAPEIVVDVPLHHPVVSSMLQHHGAGLRSPLVAALELLSTLPVRYFEPSSHEAVLLHMATQATAAKDSVLLAQALGLTYVADLLENIVRESLLSLRPGDATRLRFLCSFDVFRPVSIGISVAFTAMASKFVAWFLDESSAPSVETHQATRKRLQCDVSTAEAYGPSVRDAAARIHALTIAAPYIFGTLLRDEEFAALLRSSLSVRDAVHCNPSKPNDAAMTPRVVLLIACWLRWGRDGTTHAKCRRVVSWMPQADAASVDDVVSEASSALKRTFLSRSAARLDSDGCSLDASMRGDSQRSQPAWGPTASSQTLVSTRPLIGREVQSTTSTISSFDYRGLQRTLQRIRECWMASAYG